MAMHPFSYGYVSIYFTMQLTFWFVLSTLFSHPSGNSQSVRAKLLTALTSRDEWTYFEKRVWSLRID